MGCWCKESLSSPWSAQEYRRLRMRGIGTSGCEGGGWAGTSMVLAWAQGRAVLARHLGTQTMDRPPGLEALAFLCLSFLTYKMREG